METAAIPYPDFKSFSTKDLIGVFIFGVVGYVALASGWRPIIYGLLLLAVLWSIMSYEANLVFLLIILHAGARVDPDWYDFVSPARWVFLFIFMIKIFLPMFQQGTPDLMTRFHIGVIIYTAIASITTIDAFINPISFYRVISVWWLVLALCFSIWKYIDSREKIIEWVKLGVIVSMGFLVIGFIFGEKQLFPVPGGGRFKGIYFNPNTLAVSMVFLVPASYFLYRYEKKHGNSIPSNFYLVAFILSVIGLILSGSRSSIGAVVIAALAAAAFHYRSRFLLVMMFGLLVMGSAYAAISDMLESEFFQDVVYREETFDTMSGRIEIWENAYKYFKRKPVLGYGFGTSDFVILTEGDATRLAYLKKTRYGLHTHNSYLRSILETGVVGTSFILVFLVAFPIKVISLLRRIYSEELHMLALMFATFIFASILNSFFESWLFSVGSLPTFMFWWAVFMFYKIDTHMDEYVRPGDTERTAGLL